MTGDCHVPFRGSPGVRFPWATRLRVQPHHQIGELLVVQSCHSLVAQQLFQLSSRCLADSERRQEELLHLKRDTHL